MTNQTRDFSQQKTICEQNERERQVGKQVFETMTPTTRWENGEMPRKRSIAIVGLVIAFRFE